MVKFILLHFPLEPIITFFDYILRGKADMVNLRFSFSLIKEALILWGPMWGSGDKNCIITGVRRDNGSIGRYNSRKIGSNIDLVKVASYKFFVASRPITLKIVYKFPRKLNIGYFVQDCIIRNFDTYSHKYFLWFCRSWIFSRIQLPSRLSNIYMTNNLSMQQDIYWIQVESA
jgi:hypothetical protein